MNTNVKHWILLCFAVSIFTVQHFSCSDRSMNPNNILNSENKILDISDVRNIIWTLDKLGYEPFHLIYDETHFFGDDGCNRFGGLYEVRNDSIFPSDVVQTEMLFNLKTFSIQHLSEPYRIQITKNELKIFVNNSIITYKSEVTDSIKDSPILRNWSLITSNDPEFTKIQMKQLIPHLTFDENRGFKIAWYCVPDNLFGCDEIFGIFGTGSGGKILFYKTGWKNHAHGLEFVQRIINSASYFVEADTLILFNESNNTRYEFRVHSKVTKVQSDKGT